MGGAPQAQAGDISVDVAQKNLLLQYAFSVGDTPTSATEFTFGLWADIDGNSIYYGRAAVHGNVKSTGEGWRIGGGGQANYTKLNNRQRDQIGYKEPEPHSIDLFLASSYTISGSVPIVFGLEINYTPEILAFGQLEERFAHRSYVNFELLPAFTMRLGYHGINLFFKNDSVARLYSRFFMGLDIRF